MICTAPRALTRVIACTLYAIILSRKCIAFLISHLPAQKEIVAALVCHGLQRCAHGDNYRYASSHVHHAGPTLNGAVAVVLICNTITVYGPVWSMAVLLSTG